MIKQTPWTERKFDFSFPTGLFPVILERLKGTESRLEAITRNIPDEKLSTRVNDKWSAKEVIGHLADVEELWMGRVDDFLNGKEILRAADMSNAKTTAADHNSKTKNELFILFSTARNRLIQSVENFDETVISLVSFHPRLKQPIRLIDSLFFIAEHDDHEIAKIRALISA